MHDVAVIIPTYNCARYLPKAVESVFMQSYRLFTLIVVDDGSTDDTRTVLSPYRDKISYIYQNNSGPSKARNTGILASESRFIAFLDADDVWLPNKLERQVDLLTTNSGLAMVSCDLVLFDDKRTYEETFWQMCGCYEDVKREQKQIKNAFRKLMYHNFIYPSTALVKRECFTEVGLFDESFRGAVAEDKDMWLRIASRYNVGCVPDALVRRRMHEYSASALEAIDLSVIKVVKKMDAMFPELVKEQNVRTGQILGARYYYLGRLYLNEDELRKSREALLSSLRHSLSMRSLLFLGLALVGKRGVWTLRRVKDRMRRIRLFDFVYGWIDRNVRARPAG
ncbi:MAG: glycosyltransferase [Nitrososphaera sp.]|nr:glycosyltransferase [Nitrososphaera sp.]